jgi:hypothetical protein
MRHLIAPSSMLELEPTSIRSSSQKGMRTQHPRLSRSHRDTPSFDTHNGRSISTAGTALNARNASFERTPSNGESGGLLPLGQPLHFRIDFSLNSDFPLKGLWY